jgi:hypothetical protein
MGEQRPRPAWKRVLVIDDGAGIDPALADRLLRQEAGEFSFVYS